MGERGLDLRRDVPGHGQHTNAILRELGYSEEEIGRLTGASG
jgi:crotonobetainyl-CoA:carnitine CoA-transferase CaiB-like acyl-CoA transferase